MWLVGWQRCSAACILGLPSSFLYFFPILQIRLAQNMEPPLWSARRGSSLAPFVYDPRPAEFPLGLHNQEFARFGFLRACCAVWGRIGLLVGPRGRSLHAFIIILSAPNVNYMAARVVLVCSLIDRNMKLTVHWMRCGHRIRAPVPLALANTACGAGEDL